MKKFLIMLLSLALVLSAGVTAFAEEAAAAPEVLADWIVPEGFEGRVSVKQTDDGIVVDQLVQGTPSSHAVAIAAPIDGTKNFEVKLSITSEEFVASGRLANDVWTGIGFMGKPEFIHWRNNATDGYAKDSPGLFTRFFNYAGEFKIITDIYCGDYINDSEKPDETVDTWTILDTSAGASAEKDVTVKLSWDEVGGKQFYNLYINGNCVSGGGELSTVEPEKVFPDGKIYLEIAMNTQKKDTNMNTRVVIKEINGVSYVKNAGGENSGSGNGGNKPEKSGCGSCGGVMGGGSVLMTAVLALAAVAAKRKAN